MDFIVTENNNRLTVSANTNNVRWLCSVDGNFSLDAYTGLTESELVVTPNSYNGIASGYIYFTYFDDNCVRQYTHQVTYIENSWGEVYPSKTRFEEGYDNQYKIFNVNTNLNDWTISVPDGYMAIKVSNSKFYLIKENGGSGAEVDASINGSLVTIGSAINPSAEVTMAPDKIEGLVYNSKEQTLVSEGKANNGIIVYRVENGPWTTAPSKAINAKDDESGYTVCYMASGYTGYKNSEITCISGITIAKAPVTMTTPTPINGLVYNGKPHKLINPGYSSAGTVVYSLTDSESSYSTKIPEGVSANTNGYVVYYKVQPDDNHSGSVNGSVSVIIDKGTPTLTAPNPLTPEYTGDLQPLSTPAYTDIGVIEYSLDGNTWVSTVPRGTDVGRYTVYYRVKDDGNVNPSSGKIETEILQATPTVTPPRPKSLRYDGTEKELVDPGSTNFGIMEYSLSATSGYLDVIPKAIEVNTYTVYYLVSGNTNFKTVSGSVVSEISRNKPEYTPPSANLGLVFNGEMQELLVSGTVEASQGQMLYSFESAYTPSDSWSGTVPTASAAGTYDTYWYVSGSSGDTVYSSVGPILINVEIDKAPNGFIQEPTAYELVYMEDPNPPYSGIPQQLASSGVPSGGTMMYYNESESAWTSGVTSGVDAGDYVIWYIASGDDNYYDSESARTETPSVIKKKTPVITPPKPISPIIYNGEEQELIISGSVSGGPGVILYSFDNINWDPIPPKRKEIDSYTIAWYLPEDKNHFGIEPSYITAIISEGTAEITKHPEKKDGLEYTGQMQDLVTAGEAKNGTMVYRIGNGEWSTNIPQAKDKGSYAVFYMASGDTGYANSHEYRVDCSIGLATPEYTAPVGVSIKFDGNDHELLDPIGSVTKGGTMEYSSDNINWSTSVPKGNAAKQYTVYWRIRPDEGYSEIGPMTIIATIRDLDKPIYSPPYGINKTYTGEEFDLVEGGSVTEGGTMKYRLDGNEWSVNVPKASAVGPYTIQWKIDPDEGYSSVGPENVYSNIKDAESKDPVYSAPIGVTATYTGNEIPLVTGGSVTEGGTMLYKIQGGNWSENVPTASAPGNYDIDWMISGDTGYSDVGPYTIHSEITEKLTPDYDAPSGVTYTYTGNEIPLATGGVVRTGGTMYYKLDDTDWSTSVPTASSVGSYDVHWKIIGDEGYADVSEKIIQSKIVDKPTPTYTPPTGVTATTTGSKIQLANGGSVTEGGTMYYRYCFGTDCDDKSQWSQDIPSGETVGNYTIDWAISGDTGYSDVGPETIYSQITDKAIPVYSAPSGVTIEFDEAEHELATGGSVTTGGVMYYSYCSGAGCTNKSEWSESVPSGKNVSDYTIDWKIIGSEGYSDVGPNTIQSKITGSSNYTAPQQVIPNIIDYDGIEHDLIIPGTGTGYRFEYNINGGDYSTDIPKKSEVGNYTVCWVVEPPAPKGDSEGCFSYSIVNPATYTFTVYTDVEGASVTWANGETTVGSGTIVGGTHSFTTNNNTSLTVTLSKTGYSFNNNGTTCSPDGNVTILNAGDYVNIGGVNWATKNFGATSQTVSGGTYKWGEPDALCPNGAPWTDGYDIYAYRATRDVVYRSNNNYRMPTVNELSSINSASITLYNLTLNGVNGCLFVDSNKNSIFIHNGFYWTATAHPLGEADGGNAEYLEVNENNVFNGNTDKNNCYLIRPVYDTTPAPTPSYSVSISGTAGNTTAYGGIATIKFETSVGTLTLQPNIDFEAAEEGISISEALYTTYSGKTIEKITFTDFNGLAWNCDYVGYNSSMSSQITTIQNGGHYYITTTYCYTGSPTTFKYEITKFPWFTYVDSTESRHYAQYTPKTAVLSEKPLVATGSSESGSLEPGTYKILTVTGSVQSGLITITGGSIDMSTYKYLTIYSISLFDETTLKTHCDNQLEDGNIHACTPYESTTVGQYSQPYEHRFTYNGVTGTTTELWSSDSPIQTNCVTADARIVGGGIPTACIIGSDFTELIPGTKGCNLEINIVFSY